MRAVILSIGDELALGQTVDTNSAWLSARLARRGVMTVYHHTVADDRPAIADAFRRAGDAAELVLVSGGLGPTEDDLTRDALADALGVGLEPDEASMRRLEAFFARRSRPMPDRNRVQAMIPAGAAALVNEHGTAPGLRAKVGRADVIVMPGVPREMRGMYAAHVEPLLDAQRSASGGGRAILTTKINTFGQGESDVAEQLDGLMPRDRNPTVGTTVSDGICAVRVRSEAATPAEAEAELNNTVAEVERRLGPIVFGREDDTLQQALVALLVDRALTLATAESCTGGLIGKMITDVAGSSAVYLGGWVTYAYAMKREQLGVPAELLEAHGAVSEPVVRAMAEGALTRSGADLSLSISGVAGPGGGTAEKPVGTVWVGLGLRDDADGSKIVTRALRLLLPGSRDAVRDRSAKCALQALRLVLMGESLTHLRWAEEA